MDDEWLGGWAERRMVDGWMSGRVDQVRGTSPHTHSCPSQTLSWPPTSVDLSVSPLQDHVPFEGRTKPASHDLHL